jgi:transposase
VGRGGSNDPPELGEQAVRMIAEVRPEYPSDWSAICAVASRLGIGSYRYGLWQPGPVVDQTQDRAPANRRYRGD